MEKPLVLLGEGSTVACISGTTGSLNWRVDVGRPASSLLPAQAAVTADGSHLLYFGGAPPHFWRVRDGVAHKLPLPETTGAVVGPLHGLIGSRMAVLEEERSEIGVSVSRRLWISKGEGDGWQPTDIPGGVTVYAVAIDDQGAAWFGGARAGESRGSADQPVLFHASNGRVEPVGIRLPVQFRVVPPRWRGLRVAKIEQDHQRGCLLIRPSSPDSWWDVLSVRDGGSFRSIRVRGPVVAWVVLPTSVRYCTADGWLGELDTGSRRRPKRTPLFPQTLRTTVVHRASFLPGGGLLLGYAASRASGPDGGSRDIFIWDGQSTRLIHHITGGADLEVLSVYWDHRPQAHTLPGAPTSP